MLAADLLLLPADAPTLGLLSTYLTVTIVVGMCTLFAHYGVFVQIGHRRTAAVTDRSSRGAATPPGRRDAEPDPATGSGPVPDDAAAARPPGSTEPRAPATAPASEQPADPGPPTARQARFYNRLSRTVSRDIIYLKIDDHYVHVHTGGGSCLMLMRFADAVADLGALGMQVHRSYWVAHGHMLAAVRRDGRTMLRVTGGHYVPISRPYLPAVHEALRAKRSPPAPGGQVT